MKGPWSLLHGNEQRKGLGLNIRDELTWKGYLHKRRARVSPFGNGSEIFFDLGCYIPHFPVINAVDC